jgi:hypothetical protein
MSGPLCFETQLLILNDAKVGDIGREMVPSLKAANYD